jgi:hypothetical protein
MSAKFYRGLKFAIPLSLIMWALIFLGLLTLFGCASLAPSYVAPEFEHESHLTQHEPFTDRQTDYGANLASVVAGYNLPHHLNLEFSEGVSLDRHHTQTNQWGEIEGPREEFSARVRYMVMVRP